MKQQQAGVQALSKRVDALEKRVDALLVIIEKQSEQLNKLVDIPETTYTAQFDRWPSAR